MVRRISLASSLGSRCPHGTWAHSRDAWLESFSPISVPYFSPNPSVLQSHTQRLAWGGQSQVWEGFLFCLALARSRCAGRDGVRTEGRAAVGAGALLATGTGAVSLGKAEISVIPQVINQLKIEIANNKKRAQGRLPVPLLAHSPQSFSLPVCSGFSPSFPQLRAAASGCGDAAGPPLGAAPYQPLLHLSCWQQPAARLQPAGVFYPRSFPSWVKSPS